MSMMFLENAITKLDSLNSTEVVNLASTELEKKSRHTRNSSLLKTILLGPRDQDQTLSFLRKFLLAFMLHPSWLT
jgi:hypothetical protein